MNEHTTRESRAKKNEFTLVEVQIKTSPSVPWSLRSLEKPNLSTQIENGRDFIHVLKLSQPKHLQSGDKKDKTNLT